MFFPTLEQAIKNNQYRIKPDLFKIPVSSPTLFEILVDKAPVIRRITFSKNLSLALSKVKSFSFNFLNQIPLGEMLALKLSVLPKGSEVYCINMVNSDEFNNKIDSFSYENESFLGIEDRLEQLSSNLILTIFIKIHNVAHCFTLDCSELSDVKEVNYSNFKKIIKGFFVKGNSSLSHQEMIDALYYVLLALLYRSTLSELDHDIQIALDDYPRAHAKHSLDYHKEKDKVISVTEKVGESFKLPPVSTDEWVSGFYRMQPCGPNWMYRRLTWINPFKRGRIKYEDPKTDQNCDKDGAERN